MGQFPNHRSDSQRNDNLDQAFVQFLKQYQSVPPAPSRDLEERVMACIQSEPQSSEITQRLWMIPTAIAAGFCLLWGGSQWLKPSSQLAHTEQSQEVAAFLTDNWQTVVSAESHSPGLTPSVNDWQLLTQPEMANDLSTVYHP